MVAAVDVFAGCGGLTVGLKRAGVRVAAAIELEPEAHATYKANHPEVRTFRQDVRTVTGRSLLDAAKVESFDMLVGCPPCQGFCSLTNKYDKIDPRNELVDEMARLAEELDPSVIMMENVPGLAQKGQPIFTRLLDRLDDLGYKVKWGILQVADFGVPQRRRRLVLLAGKGFEIPLPRPTHSRTGGSGLPKWNALKSLKETFAALGNPMLLPDTFAKGGPRAAGWHVVRRISKTNESRLRSAVAGASWVKIPKRLRPACHQDKGAGFQNVYGRMTWEEPSPTITGGCTTPSKGRFGHPDMPRTLSVREAALVQTFPLDYHFESDYMDHVCNMVGNALPCDFAEVVARACVEALASNTSVNCTVG